MPSSLANNYCSRQISALMRHRGTYESAHLIWWLVTVTWAGDCDRSRLLQEAASAKTASHIVLIDILLFPRVHQRVVLTFWSEKTRSIDATRSTAWLRWGKNYTLICSGNLREKSKETFLSCCSGPCGGLAARTLLRTVLGFLQRERKTFIVLKRKRRIK